MKRNPIKTLRNRLDKVFSAYIRRRDCNPHITGLINGFGNCVTCGKWAALEAGHFIVRQHLATRWDERNVHGQCYYCNHRLHGNLISYTLFMQKRYGQEVIDELMRLKQTTVRYRKADYEAMIEKFSPFKIRHSALHDPTKWEGIPEYTVRSKYKKL